MLRLLLPALILCSCASSPREDVIAGRVPFATWTDGQRTHFAYREPDGRVSDTIIHGARP